MLRDQIIGAKVVQIGQNLDDLEWSKNLVCQPCPINSINNFFSLPCNSNFDKRWFNHFNEKISF